MIIAAQNGKLKLPKRLHEDEVTSCIFGELRHLKPYVLWFFFKQLISCADISESIWPKKEPKKVIFEFWPSITNNVEPDLIVHFYDNEKVILHIMIEVKWGALLFPKCELVRQWESRNSESPWLHMYLVKKSSKASNEIHDSLDIAKGNYCTKIPCKGCKYGYRKSTQSWNNDEISNWEERLGLLSWHDFLTALKEIKTIEPELTKGFEVFFSKQGIIYFSGFSWLDQEKLHLIEDDFYLFRPTPWFNFLAYT